MSETAINVLAIAIFLMTLSVLLGPMIHLSPLIPSVMTLTLLGLVTVDQWGWQGQGTALLLGSFATKNQRQRV
ncbi:MAG: ATP-dependent Zn protease, partial [Microcystaceae cyanobacterium]